MSCQHAYQVVTYSGMWLSTLSWTFFGILNQIKHKRTPQLSRNLYSEIRYEIEAYGTCSNMYINRLKTIQNILMKLLLRLDPKHQLMSYTWAWIFLKYLTYIKLTLYILSKKYYPADVLNRLDVRSRSRLALSWLQLIMSKVASSMSFGFPGYRQQCIITDIAYIYVSYIICNCIL